MSQANPLSVIELAVFDRLAQIAYVGSMNLIVGMSDQDISRHCILAMGKAFHKALRDALKTFVREKIETRSQTHPELLSGQRENIIQPTRPCKMTKVGFFRQMGGQHKDLQRRCPWS